MRIADRAQCAAGGHGKGQCQEEHFWGYIERSCQVEHEWRADYGQSIIHEQSGKKAHGKENKEQKLVQILGPAKQLVEEMLEIAALRHGFSYHEHPAQKYHHVRVYGTGCIQKRYLAKRENHQSAQQHDLPDLKFESPKLPYSNEDQNSSQSYDGNISAEHTRSRNSQCYNYLGSLCQNSI